MKKVLFVFIVSFIQLGFSQEFFNKVLTDTIIFDDKFLKQLDEDYDAKSADNYLKMSPVHIKIDSSNIINHYKRFDDVQINVVFKNKTTSLSLFMIRRIRGGSNYFASGDSHFIS